MTRPASLAFVLGFIVASNLAYSSGISYPPLRVQDEGSGLVQRPTLNFAGAGVSCVDDTNRTTCTISGGSAGKVAEAFMADASITAQAFETNPSDCAADTYATTIAANGNLTCAQVSVAGINATGTPSGTTYLRGDGTWSTVVGGSGYSTIEDEGVGLTSRTTLNFIGASITCVDNAGNTRTDCTISGGGGGLTFGETQRLTFLAQ